MLKLGKQKYNNHHNGGTCLNGKWLMVTRELIKKMVTREDRYEYYLLFSLSIKVCDINIRLK